jgi:hypothetical protein
MRRRLASIAAMTLLAICTVLVALWLRSRFRADTIYHQATPKAWGITSNDGGVTVGRREYSGLSLNDSAWRYYSGNVTGIGYGMRRWAFAGFVRGDIQSSVLAYSFHDDYWTVPYWFLLVVALVIPSTWIAGWYRRRAAGSRSRRGVCTSCGYDLRASPCRCPECGRSAIPAPAQPPST